MTTITLRVRTDFTYQGRPYVKDSLVEMTPTDAAIHGRQGHVHLSRIVQNRELRAAVPSMSRPLPARARTRGRYRRTDMTGA